MLYFLILKSGFPPPNQQLRHCLSKSMFIVFCIIIITVSCKNPSILIKITFLDFLKKLKNRTAIDF